MNSPFFSNSFSEAKSRFCDAALSIGAHLNSYAVDPDSPDLTIDVATLGNDTDPALVISSGVHGVEGFLGSAIQLAWIERLQQSTGSGDVRTVLIHGINPYGFANLRRFNEDGIDLNRNFHLGDDSYSGVADNYTALYEFLNPASPPPRFEPFTLKCLWLIWRHGVQPLKDAIAGGQYEYPRGLFFGGSGPAASTRVVMKNCETWLGLSDSVVHIDIHSGLGAFGRYKILVKEAADSADDPWYADVFGADVVESLAPDRTAYNVAGIFTDWVRHRFADRQIRSIGLEYGTYNVLRMLAALRAENRAHLYADEESTCYRAAKRELLECFCPRSSKWRDGVIESGLTVIEQGRQSLLTA